MKLFRRTPNSNGPRVAPLSDVPEMNTGAPCPMLVADEHTLTLLYFANAPDPEWDGTYVRVLSPDSAGEPVAIVTFSDVAWHRSGDPNEDTLHAHPLYAFGLRYYTPAEIIDPKSAHWSRHFFFPFHDSSVEVAARDYAVRVETGQSMKAFAAGLIA